MILNIGIDIEQVSRFKNQSARLMSKIFSAKELKHINKSDLQRIAGIFSAKEAVIKASNPIEKLNFRNIEILHRKDGFPFVQVKNARKVTSKDLKISISHSKDYAVAAAVLMKR